ncbi:MAG: DNA polymerase III subunit delta [Deltaproteobacteria bacterium]|nr:DNA polymerase III subunit delta [Deltaproteobacteria bacterium]
MATRASPREDPLAHLSRDGPRLVYALDGEERILVDEALKAIRDAALPERARDFNLDVLSGKDAPVARVLDAAATLPAFAARRVVVVKDAERYEKDEPEALIAYLASPSPSTVLILVATEKFDLRLRLGKALDKAGALLRFPSPNERDMPRIIEQRARALGRTIDADAARALVETIGASVSGAIEALEKLVLYVGPDNPRPITRRDVEEVVSPAKEESIFELADAVGARDLRRAFELLHSMLVVSRAHPLALLGLLANHWRRLVTAKVLAARRAPREELAAQLRVPPFVVERLVGQARGQAVPGLLAGLEAIADADQALKGGKLSAERVMERLVLRLARG